VTCSTCRHYVPASDSTGEALDVGGCHGPGASIRSRRTGEWTEDRAVFDLAAKTVGLHNYEWRGGMVSPGDLACDYHQTTEQATNAGVDVTAVFRIPVMQTAPPKDWRQHG